MSKISNPGTTQAGEVTQLLQRWSAGETGAFERLFPLVYDELRRIAARQIAGEGSNHTLQATALVNEAYLRLTDKAKASIKTRKQFFRVASQAMRSQVAFAKPLTPSSHSFSI